MERDPSGWELGVQNINLSDEFVARFSNLLPNKSLKLQFLHGDHVTISDKGLPEDIILVGSTSHCQIQGIYQRGRILTYQGHPEFDEFITTECLKLVSQRVGWEPAFAESAMMAAERKDDAAIASDIIIAFFLE